MGDKLWGLCGLVCVGEILKARMEGAGECAWEREDMGHGGGEGMGVV